MDEERDGWSTDNGTQRYYWYIGVFNNKGQLSHKQKTGQGRLLLLQSYKRSVLRSDP